MQILVVRRVERSTTKEGVQVIEDTDYGLDVDNRD